MASESSISQLLQRIARQDVSAIGELFDSMSSEVQQTFRNLADAPPPDPLIEDVFWEIWRTAARFTPESDSAYRWVMGKVACRASGHCFASGAVPDAAPERMWHAMAGSVGSGSAIQAIVSGLSLLQLRVSAQCLFLGMSVQQAAGANGVAPAQVLHTLDIVKSRMSAGAAHGPG